MRIATKVWIGLGAIIGGYLVTLFASFHFGGAVERRLERISVTVFPGASLSQRALNDLESEEEGYRGAVLFGEAALLDQAREASQAVQAGLGRLGQLPGNEPQAVLELEWLTASHRRYADGAAALYRRMALNQETDIVDAKALDLLFGELDARLRGLADGYAGALQAEQQASVLASRTQRQANLVLFVVIILVSALLFLGTIPGWTARLGRLARASEAIAQGRYDQAINDPQGDELGVLTKSLDLMRGSIHERDRQLRELNASLQQEVERQTASLVDANRHLATVNRDLDSERRTLSDKLGELSRTQAELVEAQRQEAEAHRKLMVVARHAGMAEVATGVLHNVGNVLNSVNVSAHLLAEMITAMRLERIGQIAELLAGHAGDLGRFLTEDPRGRQVPEYLSKLGVTLLADGGTMRGELALLLKNIEHIRAIVSVQQTYAGDAGLLDEVDLPELIRDAARLHLNDLARHGIELVEEFAELPTVRLDKHRLMQIMVNLIGNAKHALLDSDRRPRRLVLALRRESGQLRIEVSDNGVGIPAVNLTRIFQHGFTTKRDGHGFGLHSGALAAREMGGALTVHSAGPGSGARFTLALPETAPLAARQGEAP